ncbi:unnamed protein product, partial [Coregonus sp. 'balchen']
SYCKDHSPTQSLPVSASVNEPMSCSVCLDPIEPVLSYSILKCPACHGSWFHRDCVQNQAHSAAMFFFRCTLCNNKDMFQQEMLRMGVHIPERDASWELEENAYGELLQVYQHCDAKKCLSHNGRTCSSRTGWFQILRCALCGSSGTHRKCASLKLDETNWACEDCAAAVDGTVAGVTEVQMLVAGVTEVQMLVAGVTEVQMLVSGVTEVQMLVAGVTEVQMLVAGVTEDETVCNREEDCAINNNRRKTVSPAAGEHPLQYNYSLWYSRRTPSRPANTQSYEQNIRQIGTVASVEQFWKFYSHLIRPGDLTGHSDFHLFKEGIKPMWEEDILSIWNKTASDQVTTSRIRDTLRRVLNLPPNTIMEYKTHNDSLKDNSSFRNTKITL